MYFHFTNIFPYIADKGPKQLFCHLIIISSQSTRHFQNEPLWNGMWKYCLAMLHAPVFQLA